eukprot:21161-Heterococcus_DN1.PRE.2
MIAAVLVMVCHYVIKDLLTVNDDTQKDTNYVSRTLQNIIQRARVLPWNKLRIPIVVMQLLTQFVSITGTQYPPIYSNYLKWLDIINLDMSWLLSAGCVMHMCFYTKLLITTIVPLVVAAVILAIHLRVQCKSGPVIAIQDPATSQQRSFRTDALQQATAKHLSAFLTFTFLIYSTVSTVVFQTFACDALDGTKESWLRADYSISCNTDTHTVYKVYAAVMIAVYPIAIPLLYAVLLWRHRHSLNPATTAARTNGLRAILNRLSQSFRHCTSASTADTSVASNSEAYSTASRNNRSLQQQQQDSISTATIAKPESIRFLWSPYRQQVYCWEVVECIRRLALTGFLVFILPGTAGQSAVACVFTVIALIVFSIASPFADITDFNHYWLGCMILFLSTILALLLKGNYTASDTSSQQVLPTLLVILNVLLIVSVIAAAVVVARRALPTITKSVSAPIGPKQQLQQQHDDQEQGPPN